MSRYLSYIIFLAISLISRAQYTQVSYGVSLASGSLSGGNYSMDVFSGESSAQKEYGGDYFNFSGFIPASNIEFNIPPRVQPNIIFELVGKTYGDDSYVLSATSDSEANILFISDNADIIDIVDNVATIKKAGTVSITAVQSENEFYFSGEQPSDLIISKASLSVTMNNQTITYGDGEPEYTFELSGFVYDDDASVIDTAPVGYLVTTLGDAGEYIIKGKDGADENYNFLYQDGLLTVNKADQTITFEDLPTGLSMASPNFTLSASASSSLPVEFISLDESIALVSGSMVQILSSGEVNIKASQSGNVNYNAAPDVFQLLRIGEILGLLDSSEMIKIYPNPTSNFVKIEGLNDVARILLINLKGKLSGVFDYQKEMQINLDGIESGLYLVVIETSETKIIGGKLKIE